VAVYDSKYRIQTNFFIIIVITMLYVTHFVDMGGRYYNIIVIFIHFVF